MKTVGVPEELIIQENRRDLLLQQYYERHHEDNRDITKAIHDEQKVKFYTEELADYLGEEKSIALDIGCRGGALTKQLQHLGK